MTDSFLPFEPLCLISSSGLIVVNKISGQCGTEVVTAIQIFTYIFSLSGALCFFLQILASMWYNFSSVQRTSLSIFCGTDMLQTNSQPFFPLKLSLFHLHFLRLSLHNTNDRLKNIFF